MVTKDDSKEANKTGLEGLTLNELVESFTLEIIDYKSRLSKEDSSNSYVDRFNQTVREEYIQRTKSLREELNKREQFYLEEHRANIRY